VQARRAADETRGFLADAAHELRTPLAGIQAVAESLASAVDPRDGQQQRRALMLVRETVRAGRLVADMLDLARIEEGVELQLGDVDLVALVAAETARVRELSPAITMTTTAPPPPWWCGPTRCGSRRSSPTSSTTPAATPDPTERSPSQ
jgi:signal transduction histidine kinase